MKLFLEDGRPAGMKEIAEWWVENYPEEVFVGKTESVRLVVDVRKRMQRLLAILKEVDA